MLVPPGIVGLGVRSLRHRVGAVSSTALAITVIAGVEFRPRIPRDLRVLGKPVLTHLAYGMFLAGPVPALTVWTRGGARRLQESWYDFINWLAAAEQGSADRDLGGMDSVVPGSLI